MIRSALASAVLCLAGCFVFDNPYDTSSIPTATLQIAVTSNNYGGTYVWSSQDNAYEAVVGNTLCSVYMDSGGTWRLTYGTGNIVASSTNPNYGTLPPTLSWSGSGTIISSIDDSEGGIYVMTKLPDGRIPPAGGTLQVVFLASNPGNGATYQWQRSLNQSFDSPVPIGNLSTYTLQFGLDYMRWIRVIITPTDSTGRIQGTPVVSQPVYWP